MSEVLPTNGDNSSSVSMWLNLLVAQVISTIFVSLFFFSNLCILVGAVKDKIGGGPARDGYGAVGSGPESAGMYGDGGHDEDLFGEYSPSGRYDEPQQTTTSQGLVGASSTRAAPAAKNNGWDDEWKDF